MKTQLLSGVGKRVLSSMLICCLWVCAVPADARADAAIQNATCSVQKVTNGMMVMWQIKGTASVTGVNPQNTSVTVTFKFQKKANGDTMWTDLLPTVDQTTNAQLGNANFDAGWQSLGGGPPGQGDQYRVWVNGFYIDGTGQQVQLPGIASTAITPVP